MTRIDQKEARSLREESKISRKVEFKRVNNWVNQWLAHENV